MAQDKAGGYVSLIPKLGVCFRIIFTFMFIENHLCLFFEFFVFETNMYHVLRGSKINFKLDMFTFNTAKVFSSTT